MRVALLTDSLNCLSRTVAIGCCFVSEGRVGSEKGMGREIKGERPAAGREGQRRRRERERVSVYYKCKFRSLCASAPLHSTLPLERQSGLRPLGATLQHFSIFASTTYFHFGHQFICLLQSQSIDLAVWLMNFSYGRPLSFFHRRCRFQLSAASTHISSFLREEAPKNLNNCAVTAAFVFIPHSSLPYGRNDAPQFEAALAIACTT